MLPRYPENTLARVIPFVELSLSHKLLDGQSRTLESALSKVAQQYDLEKVTIRADANTPHQYVVSVMDAAGKIGLSKVFIATSSEQDDIKQ